MARKRKWEPEFPDLQTGQWFMLDVEERGFRGYIAVEEREKRVVVLRAADLRKIEFRKPLWKRAREQPMAMGPMDIPPRGHLAKYMRKRVKDGDLRSPALVKKVLKALREHAKALKAEEKDDAAIG